MAQRLARLAFFEFETATNQAICGIRSKTQAVRLPEFLFYFLFRRQDDWSLKQPETRSRTFPRSKSKSLQFRLSPLPEQQRIVGILDEAFEGIATAKANAEKNLQNARALFESHLQSVFTQRGQGWAETPVGEVCEFIGGRSRRSRSSRKRRRPITFVSSSSVITRAIIMLLISRVIRPDDSATLTT